MREFRLGFHDLSLFVYMIVMGEEKMTYASLLHAGREVLWKNGVQDYRLDASLLLEHVFGLDTAAFFMKAREPVGNGPEAAHFLALIERRASGEPLQYITGSAWFMGLEFEVDESVLIPRQDTEVLAGTAMELLNGRGSARVLDVCTGSGCIVLSLAKLLGGEFIFTGADISESALEVAKFNAKIVKASNNKKLKSKTIYNNDDEKFIKIPNKLTNFINTDTIETESKIVIEGILKVNEDDYICPNCGHKMEIHDGRNVSLKHLKIGNKQTLIKFRRVQFYCNECNHSHMQKIPFKIEKHFITTPLYNYIKDLLSTGHYTNVEVSELTGVNRNIVKEIDKERLLKKYTIDGKGKEIIKPEVQAKFLGIDEFKLHNGYKYATHIINLENGHILWIEEGKKKQVVYNFINHVGDEWMKKVIAVACDMNSDFEEAFKEKCPHIEIVYDYFHIVKNFNEKVVAEVRKDEEKRLKDEGNIEGAKMLKGSKYWLLRFRTLEYTIEAYWRKVHRVRRVLRPSAHQVCQGQQHLLFR